MHVLKGFETGDLEDKILEDELANVVASGSALARDLNNDDRRM